MIVERECIHCAQLGLGLNIDEQDQKGENKNQTITKEWFNKREEYVGLPRTLGSWALLMFSKTIIHMFGAFSLVSIYSKPSSFHRLHIVG